jgi:hypothetical protein
MGKDGQASEGLGMLMGASSLKVNPERQRLKQGRGRASHTLPVLPAESNRGPGRFEGSRCLARLGEEWMEGSSSRSPLLCWLKMSQAHHNAPLTGTGNWQNSGGQPPLPSHPIPTLCPFLFQNKVVTVDGARVKLQVQAEAGAEEGLVLACLST